MPLPTDLTDLFTLKKYINPVVAGSTVSDVILQDIISGVSDAFARYCSREFPIQQRVEVRNGNGRQYMRTLIYPIESVQSVVIAPLFGQPGQTLTTNNYSHDNWFIYLTPGGFFGNAFQRGYQNVTLTYTGGYITPGQLACISLPAWTGS